jgi:hypothetical protein
VVREEKKMNYLTLLETDDVDGLEQLNPTDPDLLQLLCLVAIQEGRNRVFHYLYLDRGVDLTPILQRGLMVTMQKNEEEMIWKCLYTYHPTLPLGKIFMWALKYIPPDSSAYDGRDMMDHILPLLKTEHLTPPIVQQMFQFENNITPPEEMMMKLIPLVPQRLHEYCISLCLTYGKWKFVKQFINLGTQPTTAEVKRSFWYYMDKAVADKNEFGVSVLLEMGATIKDRHILEAAPYWSPGHRWLLKKYLESNQPIKGFELLESLLIVGIRWKLCLLLDLLRFLPPEDKGQCGRRNGAFLFVMARGSEQELLQLVKIYSKKGWWWPKEQCPAIKATLEVEVEGRMWLKKTLVEKFGAPEELHTQIVSYLDEDN